MNKKLILILIALLFLTTTNFSQTTLYSSLGGGAFNPPGNAFISTTSFRSIKFDVGSPGYSNITVEAYLSDDGTAGDLTVSIFNDDGSDNPTGSALASGTVAVTSSTVLESINFSTLQLNAGTYHAVVSSSGINGRWYANDQSVTGVGVTNDGGSSWNYLSGSLAPAGRITAQTTLPVELTSFDGYNTYQGIVLNWETATEVNNYGFQVQRTKDKVQSENEWEDIGFVPGYGTTNSPKYYEFTDSELPDADEVSYRLKQIDNDGTFAYSKIVTVDLTNITSLDDEVVYEFSLEQNYPNPFNPETSIEYQVASIENVIIKVYDVLGNEVTTLVSEQKAPGIYSVKFDGNNLSSGMYFYRINAGDKFNSVRKMLLIK